MYEDNVVPRGTTTIEAKGLLTESWTFVHCGIVMGQIQTRFLGRPHIIIRDGSYYIIHSQKHNLPAFWLTYMDHIAPLSTIVADSADKHAMNICWSPTNKLYKVAGQLLNVGKNDETVLISLRNIGSRVSLAELFLPQHILKVREPAETALIAFYYFVAIKHLYHEVSRFVPPVFA